MAPLSGSKLLYNATLDKRYQIILETPIQGVGQRYSGFRAWSYNVTILSN